MWFENSGLGASTQLGSMSAVQQRARWCDKERIVIPRCGVCILGSTRQRDPSTALQSVEPLGLSGRSSSYAWSSTESVAFVGSPRPADASSDTAQSWRRDSRRPGTLRMSRTCVADADTTSRHHRHLRWCRSPRLDLGAPQPSQLPHLDRPGTPTPARRPFAHDDSRICARSVKQRCRDGEHVRRPVGPKSSAPGRDQIRDGFVDGDGRSSSHQSRLIRSSSWLACVGELYRNPRRADE